MKSSCKRFSYGATYAPLIKATEVDSSEWESDLRNMAELGFNTFRAFVPWDRIEREEGIRDFDKVDLVFDLAEKYGLKIVLNVGGVFLNLAGLYPPQWVVKKYNCQHLVPDPARPEKPLGPRLTVCYDDPLYMEKAGNFIRTAVRRYKNSPALDCWAVWNEPYFKRCYCPYSLHEFRNFLENKYLKIENLVGAWSTEFPVNYEDWSEITPPENVGFHAGGYPPFLDWLEFNNNQMIKKISWINDIVKSEDTTHPTTLNNCSAYPRELLGYDLNAVGRTVDVQGYSYYTTHYPEVYKVEFTPREQYRRNNSVFSSLRSSSNAPDKKFKVLEAEGGPRLWNRHAIHVYRDDKICALRDWTAVAYGAETILGWLFRSRISDAQSGDFNMVGWDGSLTERVISQGRRSRLIISHQESILNAAWPKPEIAVWYDVSSIWLAECERYLEADFCHESAVNAYLAVKDAGFSAEYIDDNRLNRGIKGEYKALIIPFRPHLSAENAAKIEEFVKTGGLVITEAPFALKDLRGIHRQITPGFGLNEVFGFTCFDLLTCENEGITLDSGESLNCSTSFSACTRPLPAAAVSGKIRDGFPGIIYHCSGEGKTVFFSTTVFSGYKWECVCFRELLTSQLKAAGIEPEYKLQFDDADFARAGAVGIYPLYDRDRHVEWLFLCNHNPEPVDIKITLNAERGSERLMDVVSEREIVFNDDGKTITIDVSLNAQQVMVVKKS